MTSKTLLKLITKIHERKPFSLQFEFAGGDQFSRINAVYYKVLASRDQLYLLNSVITIMREVVTNAQKANAKRLYFGRKRMDIADSDEYDIGMADFKQNVVADFDSLAALLKGSGYFVKISFKYDYGGLTISVTNNAEMLPEELRRVRMRIRKATEYRSIMEAFDDIHDPLEGAGLGIALTVITLKTIGIDPDNFTVRSNEGLTTVSLRVPDQILPQHHINTARVHLVDMVEWIPAFSGNVETFHFLLDSQPPDFVKIVQAAFLDPSLTAELMKLTVSKDPDCLNMAETVRELDMQSLHNLALSTPNLFDYHNEYREIWKHSQNVARYGRMIAERYYDKLTARKVYLGGILHDLGKVILLSWGGNITNRMKKELEATRRSYNAYFLEEINVGLCHSEIGSMIAIKWGFPGYLVEAIDAHHWPQKACAENRQIVNALYLADMIDSIDRYKFTSHDIDESVLQEFGLLDEESFRSFSRSLKEEGHAP